MFGHPDHLRGLAAVLYFALALCTSVASAAGEVVLTTAERDFLAAHPRIEFGTDADWEPFVIVDAQGGVTGYDADILARINALTGADIRLVPGRWAQMVERADRRDIDGLSTSAVHPERRSRFSFSNRATGIPRRHHPGPRVRAGRCQLRQRRPVVVSRQPHRCALPAAGLRVG